MTEREIQDAFAKWLDDAGVPYIRSRMDMKTTIQVGWPDFTILWMGRSICIETKAAGGKLSKKQVARINYIQSAGNRVEVCNSVEACQEAARSILCGHPTVFEPLSSDLISRQREEGLRIIKFAGKKLVVRQVGEGYDIVREATEEDVLRML